MFSAMSCSSVSATSSRYALMGPSDASAQKSNTTTPSTLRMIPIGCLPGWSPMARPESQGNKRMSYSHKILRSNHPQCSFFLHIQKMSSGVWGSVKYNPSWVVGAQSVGDWGGFSVQSPVPKHLQSTAEVPLSKVLNPQMLTGDELVTPSGLPPAFAHMCTLPVTPKGIKLGEIIPHVNNKQLYMICM